MLKYKINVKNANSKYEEIKLSSYNISNQGVSFDKILVFCFCKDKVSVNNGDNITIIKKHFTNYNDNLIENTFYENTKVDSINYSENSFTCISDRFYRLNINKIVRDDSQLTINKYFLIFSKNHFFNKEDNIELYVNLYNGNIENQYIKIDNCEFVSDNTLSVIIDNSDLIESISANSYKNIPILRNNFIEDNINGITVIKNRNIGSICIPFSNNFETDIYKEHNINNFIKDEIDSSINQIVDMEKQSYHPVLFIKQKNGTENKKMEFVDKIKINLHFRQHRGDNWQCNTDSLWNGIKSNDEEIINSNGANVLTYNKYKYGFIDEFFSYENKSNQSDLMYYADFTDLDIKYQKNKLKKSFLRFSFYDSKNPSNQTLLAYSTVFIDSGRVFSKFIKNINSKPYLKINERTDSTIFDKNKYIISRSLVGAKCDREPYGDLVNIDEDVTEKYRISTQFVIDDKFNSDSNSSEGFYIYLWKDDSHLLEKDLYLKIEYNNAEYGRTIPFMMPYKLKNERVNEKERIKSFEDILYDWNPILSPSTQDENEHNKNIGYSILKYNEFSYIKLKYRYDIETDMYVYYLDDDQYGDSVLLDNKTDKKQIVLNLYEAKIR